MKTWLLLMADTTSVFEKTDTLQPNESAFFGAVMICVAVFEKLPLAEAA